MMLIDAAHACFRFDSVYPFQHPQYHIVEFLWNSSFSNIIQRSFSSGSFFACLIAFLDSSPIVSCCASVVSLHGFVPMRWRCDLYVSNVLLNVLPQQLPFTLGTRVCGDT